MMAIHTITLPDIGEGVAEAELTEWIVSVGDEVREDDILATVMTDKAAIEVPSSVSGKIIWLGGKIGERLAIGSNLVQIETGTEMENETEIQISENEVCVEHKFQQDQPSLSEAQNRDKEIKSLERTKQQRCKTRAAPAVRKRAKKRGVDLSKIKGTGPEGRITHEDLDDFLFDLLKLEKPVETLDSKSKTQKVPHMKGDKQIKVVGMRRMIAEKMMQSKSHIPHITIVEEVDVSDLENYRSTLNETYSKEKGKLTILPFIARAIMLAIEEHPIMNAHFNDKDEVIHQFDTVNLGVATQTPQGLIVPVVKRAERLELWEIANEILKLSELAKEGSAKREQLTGSTITISSLGPLGAIATTPIINHPEVAIIGVNKIQTRPVFMNETFAPRQMMNLSCAFDHRIIDGWQAAHFVQKLKNMLETPLELAGTP